MPRERADGGAADCASDCIEDAYTGDATEGATKPSKIPGSTCGGVKYASGAPDAGGNVGNVATDAGADWFDIGIANRPCSGDGGTGADSTTRMAEWLRIVLSAVCADGGNARDLDELLEGKLPGGKVPGETQPVGRPVTFTAAVI